MLDLIQKYNSKMFIMELDTFVRKFHQLWNDGITAHLDVDTHAGNAWVGLRVQLGQVPGPPHQHVQQPPQQIHRKFESPSRKKRRARREAARAKNTEAVEAVETDIENKESGEVSDVAEMHEDTAVEKNVSEVAVEASKADIIDTLEDAFCSDEEYKNKLLRVIGILKKTSSNRCCLLLSMMGKTYSKLIRLESWRK